MMNDQKPALITELAIELIETVREMAPMWLARLMTMESGQRLKKFRIDLTKRCLDVAAL